MAIFWDTWEGAADSTTLTTRTRMWNQGPLWRHGSSQCLPHKLLTGCFFWARIRQFLHVFFNTFIVTTVTRIKVVVTWFEVSSFCNFSCACYSVFDWLILVLHLSIQYVIRLYTVTWRQETFWLVMGNIARWRTLVWQGTYTMKTFTRKLPRWILIFLVEDRRKFTIALCISVIMILLNLRGTVE